MAVITRDTFPDLGRKHMAKKLTKAKAREILRHGEVRGHKLTKKQRGFFGARASGAKRLHNPQSPYNDQSAVASRSSTPNYSASGKLGRLA